MLAKEGVDVAICARRKEPLEAAAAEIAKETGRKIVADHRRPAAGCRRQELHRAGAQGARPHRHHGQQCGLGRRRRHRTFDGGRLGKGAAAQVHGLRALSALRACRSCVKQGGGRVVNLIGNDGVKPSYWEICPGAANAAGQNLTLSLAGQYGKERISFVAVNPGPVRTERWSGLVKAMSRDMKISYEEADKLAPASIPMGRIAEVDEVATLVTMLASPLMEMVNGTMIEIDGGQDKPLMDRFRDRSHA